MPDNKPMTPQRMREIAAFCLGKAAEKERLAKATADAAQAARNGKPVEIGRRRFSLEELENLEAGFKREADEWAPLKVAAVELQDYSFTMKG